VYSKMKVVSGTSADVIGGFNFWHDYGSFYKCPLVTDKQMCTISACHIWRPSSGYKLTSKFTLQLV